MATKIFFFSDQMMSRLKS